MLVHVVGGSQMLRDMFSSICGQQGYKATAQYSDLNELKALEAGDMVLLYSDQKDMTIHKKVLAHKTRWPDARLLIVTSKTMPAAVRDALWHEADAIICESKRAEALAAAMTVVDAGYRIVGSPVTRPNGKSASTADNRCAPRITAKTKDRNSGSKPPRRAKLSDRESAILAKLVDGSTNKDIANSLGICEATVKVHLRTCFKKIGAKNRTQAAMWAAKQL